MLLKKSIIFFGICYCLFSTAYAQKNRLKPNYLGFGWVVIFPYDIAFIPYNRTDKIPTIQDFFRQTNKFGLRLNEDEEVYESLKSRKYMQITWQDNEPDSIAVIPVIAKYTMTDINISGIGGDTMNLKANLYNYMLQVYNYNGNVDSVMYEFGRNYEIELKVLR